ncbi:hypothetical protein TeGR_g5006, partial [Tetraparma gracilis]
MHPSSPSSLSSQPPYEQQQQQQQQQQRQQQQQQQQQQQHSGVKHGRSSLSLAPPSDDDSAMVDVTKRARYHQDDLSQRLALVRVNTARSVDSGCSLLSTSPIKTDGDSFPPPPPHLAPPTSLHLSPPPSPTWSLAESVACLCPPSEFSELDAAA